MEKTLEIRNLCIERIRKGFAESGIAVTELNGNHFAGADIAVKENNDISLYRIAVIKHDQERRFE